MIFLCNKNKFRLCHIIFKSNRADSIYSILYLLWPKFFAQLCMSGLNEVAQVDHENEVAQVDHENEVAQVDHENEVAQVDHENEVAQVDHEKKQI